VITRRALSRTACAGLLGQAVGTAEAGQSLRLLVGAQPGSASDRQARAFAPFLERHLPHTEIGLTNLPGEAGLVAYRALAEADPSGRLLGWVSTPVLPARMIDRGGGGLMDRLRLLGATEVEPIAFVSPAASPLVTAQDIIRRSDENADAVPLGTPPAGSAPHLAALRLQAVSGTHLNIVAFPSTAAARQAVIARNVAAAALGLADAIGALRDGKLVGLGVAMRDRANAFPDMPPLYDLGIELFAPIRRGLAAPALIPAEVAERIADAMQEVVADPEFLAEAEDAGFIATWLDGAAWTAQALQERSELAQLWHASPWLSEGTG
jgi:tripartite-type tricarboxylate transporter receptor subunit TctC